MRANMLLWRVAFLLLPLAPVEGMLTPQMYLPVVSRSERPATVLILSSFARTYAFNGATVIIGEVINGTDRPVRPTITAHVYDASGAPLGTGITTTMILQLAPGQRSPFIIITLPVFVSYALSLEFAAPPQSSFRPLTVLSQAIQVRDSGIVEITGELRNDETVPVRYVQVAAALYSGSGEMSDAGSGYLADSIVPGAVAQYSVMLPPGTNASNRLVVQAQGEAHESEVQNH